MRDMTLSSAGPQVHRLAPPAMISLRAKPGTAGLPEAVRAASGCDLPGQRLITRAGAAICAWMSPDEFLLVLPATEGGRALAALNEGLKGQHYLAADVSDARVFFQISGSRADQVLMRLTPADISSLGPDEIRRSRLAQVAAAFWRDGDGCRLVAFRSVGDYVEALLVNAAGAAGEATIL